MSVLLVAYRNGFDLIGSFLAGRISAATAKSLQLCPTLATPWTAAYQAPPSMGFSRQKYWSGVPLPSPSILLSSDFLSRSNCSA